LIILDSTGLEELDDDDDVEDLAGLLSGCSGDWGRGERVVVESCRVESRWRGRMGDLGRLEGSEDKFWDVAEAGFWFRTVGVAERENRGGRTAVSEVLRGVPAPDVMVSGRGRGESRRMEVGDDGRLPLPEGVRLIDPLFEAAMSCAETPDGKPALMGEAAPLVPVTAAALRNRPMSWFVWRSARVWAIMRRKSTPTPKDVAL